MTAALALGVVTIGVSPAYARNKNRVSTNTPLSVTGTATPQSGAAPLQTSFTAKASGGSSPYVYTWAFGDGSQAGTQNVTHTFTNVGSYTTVLVVKDSLGATATTSWSITVSQSSSTGTATGQGGSTQSGPATVTTPPLSSGQPIIGTPSSPMNLPISYWNVGVDVAATQNLQSALKLSSYSSMYWTIGDDSFATYYASASDPAYLLEDTSGNAKSCTGGGGTVYTSVHIPQSVTSSWNGLYNTTNDQHFSVVDTTSNQIFAFYSSSGNRLGVYNGGWQSQYRSCDYLANPNGDAQVSNAVINRNSCTSFPCSNIEGIGAGVGIGGTSASDRNAFMSPYGDILPQDFDDTGWSGDAVGTFHHALYTVIPNGYIAGAVWPTPNEGGSNSSLKNGQIIQLDPIACSATPFDVSCFGPNDRRIAKTLMVYGAVISDFGSYGPKLSGQFSGKDQNGVQHYANPWTPSGTPGLSQAAYAEISAATNNGTANVIYTTTINNVLSKLRVILPHGPTY